MLFEKDKKKHIKEMFNSIAFRYDFLNHFLSMGIDQYWRKKAVCQLSDMKPRTVLDIASGTADFAICAFKELHPSKIIGIDISEKMLEIGRKKIQRKKMNHCISLISADSENMPFQDGSFDAITVGFGVRNFENLEAGLKEMYRVLNNNGKIVILEFSKPQAFPIKQIYQCYLKYFLPLLGRIVSKDKIAYSYLHASVIAFPDKHNFLKLMNKAGFKNTKFISLSLGIVSIYVGSCQ